MNSGLLKFCDIYEKHLRQAVLDHPQEYCYPVNQVSVVVDKMIAAFGNMSFNKDSRAIKNTCKELGIKHTYKAMEEFFKLGAMESR